MLLLYRIPTSWVSLSYIYNVLYLAIGFKTWNAINEVLMPCLRPPLWQLVSVDATEMTVRWIPDAVTVANIHRARCRDCQLAATRSAVGLFICLATGRLSRAISCRNHRTLSRWLVSFLAWWGFEVTDVDDVTGWFRLSHKKCPSIYSFPVSAARDISWRHKRCAYLQCDECRSQSVRGMSLKAIYGYLTERIRDYCMEDRLTIWHMRDTVTLYSAEVSPWHSKSRVRNCPITPMEANSLNFAV
jgi:hypothetical protein